MALPREVVRIDCDVEVTAAYGASEFSTQIQSYSVHPPSLSDGIWSPDGQLLV
jgi:hypothetical protein